MEQIKSYKGFNPDMTCRGKQYEEGKDYEEDCAEACNSGMHACEYPLDCFSYYPPGKSVYHEVTQSGELSRNGDDSKVSSTKMRIGARLDIVGIVKASIEYTKSKITTNYINDKAATAGDSGAATAGDSGAATAGNYGAATAGDYGAAAAGYKGAATAGNSGAATAGDYGAATAGYKGAATAGDSGAATSRGMSASGENGLSVARGNNVKVKGGLGAILVVVEEEPNNYNIKNWKATVVDGEKIKPNIWYRLKDGNFTEVEE